MSAKNTPAVRFQKITLSGVVTISPACRMVTIGTGGVLNCACSGMTVRALTDALPAGSYPMEMTSIDASGTTAAGITVWW